MRIWKRWVSLYLIPTVMTDLRVLMVITYPIEVPLLIGVMEAVTKMYPGATYQSPGDGQQMVILVPDRDASGDTEYMVMSLIKPEEDCG